VASFYPGKRILVLFRYHHEADTLFSSICDRCGAESVACYPLVPEEMNRPYMMMNVYADEREYARLQADVIIYYSGDWNWRKRQEKERQCQNALKDGELIVVDLIAADTIDELILRCIWKKENLVNQLRKELMKIP